MEVNIGSSDRVVRLVVGGLLAAAGVGVLAGDFAASPLLAVGSVLVGVVLISTAVTRFCPVYRLLGTSTCRT